MSALGSDASNQKVSIELGTELPYAMHQAGLLWDVNESDLDLQSWSRLKDLQLSHIRVDIQDSGDVAEALSHALAVADRLGTKLEIACRSSEQGVERLVSHLAAETNQSGKIARVLLYSENSWNTKPATVNAWFARAAQMFGDRLADYPVFIGTLANFTELNRDRSALFIGDGICYSVQPQEHAFDNLSLVETPKVLGQTVESTKAFAPGKPIAVTPITLRKRVNPYGAALVEEVESGLPPTVDPRQMSLLGAGWTLACLKHLSESGAGSSTWYQPLGWKGVMESPCGSLNAEFFRSVPSMLFPVYHVLKEWSRWSGGKAFAVRSSNRLRVEAAACRVGKTTRWMIANLREEPTIVSLEGLGIASKLYHSNVRHLDSYSILDFDSALGGGSDTTSKGANIDLTLRPFAIAFVAMTELHDE